MTWPLVHLVWAWVVASWTGAAQFVAALFILIEGHKKLRDQGWLDWSSPADNYVRLVNDFLHVRPHYPANRYPSSTPDTEEEFYAEFSKHIRTAKHRIYNSGDGFNMLDRSNDPGKLGSGDKADKLDGALIHALNTHKDCRYTRFQITSACGLSWISRLIWMKEEYGDRFKVFTNPAYDHLGCFCAIDPHDYRCVFEWQILSARQWIGSPRTKGYGFIYTNRDICKKLETIFEDIELSFAHMHDPYDIYGDMDADRLRKYQRVLWDTRVKLVKLGGKIIDMEISIALKTRGLNRNTFSLDDMQFDARDFPVIRYPSQK